MISKTRLGLGVLTIFRHTHLVGGFEHFFIFHIIYGMSSFPLTNSYFSRWLLHQQPGFNVVGPIINQPYTVTTCMGGSLCIPSHGRFMAATPWCSGIKIASVDKQGLTARLGGVAYLGDSHCLGWQWMGFGFSNQQQGCSDLTDRHFLGCTLW